MGSLFAVSSVKKRCYVFLVQRMSDAFPWPCVMTKPIAAERFQGRVTPVIVVEFDYLPPASAPPSTSGLPVE